MKTITLKIPASRPNNHTKRDQLDFLKAVTMKMAQNQFNSSESFREHIPFGLIAAESKTPVDVVMDLLGNGFSHTGVIAIRSDQSQGGLIQ